ncbi:MAG TPA: hypothetical protein VG755_23465 [Nannocystaceae bacterium]|nr:hypothetical protein [Nannocystaceae bacterium]
MGWARGAAWGSLVALVVGCRAADATDDDGSGGTSAESETSGTAPESVRLVGSAEKGPLVTGASVLAARLDASGMATGETYLGAIVSDAGEFDIGDVPAGVYRLEATGFHFDEVRAHPSEAPITLRAIVELGDDAGAIHINSITEVTHRRVLDLIAEGVSPSDAIDQAEAELVAMLPLGSPGTSVDEPGTELSMTAGDSPGARYLLGVSATLANVALQTDDGQSVDARLQEWMSTIASALVEQTTLGEHEPAWLAALATLDAAEVEATLSARLVELDLPAAVPDLDLVLDQDRDGVRNADDNCPAYADPAEADADADDIGDPCDPYPYGDPELLVELDGLGDFALGDGAIYFTSPGALWVADGDGGGVEMIASVPDSIGTLRWTPSRLYFLVVVDGEQNLMEMALPDGVPSLVTTAEVETFDIDADEVYWGRGGYLFRRAHDGDEVIEYDGGDWGLIDVFNFGVGPSQLVASSQHGFGPVATVAGEKHGTDFPEISARINAFFPFEVDDYAAYWTDRSECALFRATLDGLQDEAIWRGVQDASYCTGITTPPTAAGDRIYLAGEDEVRRVGRDGGEPQFVAGGDWVSNPSRVLVDDEFVWWINRAPRAIARVRLPWNGP